MSLQIASINSGSNGNCYYIGNSSEAVLIDAGISCRETERRMQRLNLDIKKVKAIFISHEHSDHIKGVEVLSKKYNLPVYITTDTLLHSGLLIDKNLRISFSAYEKISIGDLGITAFPKYHDAADPHSFIVTQNGINVGVLTDIGSACDHVYSNFSKCHAVFLEANYDHTMLTTGNYPYHLQRRIMGNHGHLSNDQALEIFTRYRSEHLTHVLLSHLSKDNNSPELVHELFKLHANGVHVEVASRYNESPVFTIVGSPVNFEEEMVRDMARENYQMKLF